MNYFSHFFLFLILFLWLIFNGKLVNFDKVYKVKRVKTVVYIIGWDYIFSPVSDKEMFGSEYMADKRFYELSYYLTGIDERVQ